MPTSRQLALQEAQQDNVEEADESEGDDGASNGSKKRRRGSKEVDESAPVAKRARIPPSTACLSQKTDKTKSGKNLFVNSRSVWPFRSKLKVLRENVEENVDQFIHAIEEMLKLDASQGEMLKVRLQEAIEMKSDLEGVESVSMAFKELAKCQEAMEDGFHVGYQRGNARLALGNVAKALGSIYGHISREVGLASKLDEDTAETTKEFLKLVQNSWMELDDNTLSKILLESATELMLGRKNSQAHPCLSKLMANNRSALLPLSSPDRLSLQNTVYALGFFEGLENEEIAPAEKSMEEVNEAEISEEEEEEEEEEDETKAQDEEEAKEVHSKRKENRSNVFKETFQRWKIPLEERTRTLLRRARHSFKDTDEAGFFLRFYPKVMEQIFPLDEGGKRVEDPVVPMLPCDEGWEPKGLSWWGVQQCDYPTPEEPASASASPPES